MVAAFDGTVDCSTDGRGQGNEGDLVALAVHPHDPVAVGLAEVFDARAGRFEDPQAEESEQGHEGDVGRGRRASDRAQRR